jgi:uncharacterized protein YqgQ
MAYGKKIIIYFKDEVYNFNAMIIVLKSLVSYEYIRLEEYF